MKIKKKPTHVQSNFLKVYCRNIFGRNYMVKKQCKFNRLVQFFFLNTVTILLT